MKTIFTDKAPAAVGPYSQAKVVGGLLFASVKFHSILQLVPLLQVVS